MTKYFFLIIYNSRNYKCLIDAAAPLKDPISTIVEIINVL